MSTENTALSEQSPHEMKPRRTVRRLLLIAAIAVFLFVFLVAALITSVLVPALRTAQYRARVARATVEVKMLSVALGFHWTEYGNLPNGDESSIMKVLTATNSDGQNPRRIVFVEVPTKSLDARGGFLDPWGRP